MNFTKSFGAMPPKYDLRDYRLYVAGSTIFPESFSLGKPEIKNQNNVSSCVAHALSYVIEKNNEKQEKNKESFSTEFIYGYRPTGYYKGQGMYLREALNTIHKVGDVKHELLPGNNEVPKAIGVVDAVFKEVKDKAYPNRVSSYVSLKGNEEIKSALMNYGYVLISIKWYSKSTIIDGIYQYDDKSDYGYHALTIFGWNTNGWLVANSWGKNWGNSGTFILPFNFKLSEAWGIIDDITIEKDNMIVKPKRNRILDVIYRLLNFLINLFKKR